MIQPNQPVRGSRSGRPIMALLDLLGQRWTLRIIWELRNGQALNFRDLRTACDELSPTVLNKRLHELRAAGVIEMIEGQGYQLTEEGHNLLQSLLPLNGWAERWAKRVGQA